MECAVPTHIYNALQLFLRLHLEMSELLQQVARLHDSNLQSSGVQAGRPSLFLTAKEAANIDVSVVHEAAVSGLKVLMQYEVRFTRYLDTLLHPNSISTQRELQTSSENAVLDKEINSLLSLLSLYAAEMETHRVLEYLIRRYRINEMNVDSLLKCMLHLNDTKIFAKTVQLSSIADTRWSFLHGVKKSGSPLPTELFVQKCQDNVHILSILVQMAQTAMSLSSTKINLSARTVKGVGKIISFVTNTVSAVLKGRAADEAQIRLLLPYIVNGLQSHIQGIANSPSTTTTKITHSAVVEELRRSCCIIVAHVCAKSHLDEHFVKTLFGLLVDAFISCSEVPLIANSSTSSSQPGVEIMYTLMAVSQTQELKLSSKLIHKMFELNTQKSVDNNYFLSALQLISDNDIDTSHILKAIVSGIISGLFLPAKKREKLGVNASTARQILLKIFANSAFSDSSVVAAGVVRVLTCLCTPRGVSAAGTDEDGLGAEAARDVLRYIAQCYPKDFDNCVSTFYSNGSDGEGALAHVLAETFAEASHHLPLKGGVSLNSSLAHDSAHVRIQALAVFAGIPLASKSTPDVVAAAEAALTCLSDEDAVVSIAAWSDAEVLQRVAKHLGATAIATLVEKVVKYWTNRLMVSPKRSSKVLEKIVGNMTFLIDALIGSGESLVFSSGLDGGSYFFLLFSTFAASSFPNCRHNDDSKILKRLRAIRLLAWEGAFKIQHYAKLFNGLPAPDSKSYDENKFMLSISACLVSAITASPAASAECLSSLHQLIKFAHFSDDSRSDYMMSSLVIEAISTMIASMSCKASDVKAAESSRVLIGLLFPLLLRMALSRDEEKISASVEFMTKLMTVSKPVFSSSGSNPAKKKKANEQFESFALWVSSPINARHVGSRVLIVVLSCPDSRISSLLGPCLSTFFPDSPSSVLLKIAMSSSFAAAEGVLPQDSGLYTTGDAVTSDAKAQDIDELGDRTCLLVSPEAKAGAIYALASFCTSLLSTGKLVNAKREDLMCLLALGPVIVSSCSDEFVAIRLAGLDMATALSGSIAALTFDSGFFITKIGKGLNHAPELREIRDLCVTLLKASATISMDPKSSTDHLAKKIFASDDKSNQALQHTLLYLCTVLFSCNPLVVSSILEASTAMNISSSWPYVRNIIASIMDSHVSKDPRLDYAPLIRSALRPVEKVSTSRGETLEDIVSFIIQCVGGDFAGDLYLSRAVQLEVLRLLDDGCIEGVQDRALVERLYEALCHSYMRRPGNAMVLSALTNTSVELAVPLTLVTKESETFTAVFAQRITVSSSGARVGAENDDDAEDFAVSGMAAPLQRLCSMLEIARYKLSSGGAASHTELLSKIVASLMDILKLLNNESLRTVLSLEYSKVLVLDFATDCISGCGEAILYASSVEPTATKKTAKVGRPRRESSSASESSPYYTLTRVKGDIQSVLLCAGSARSNQLQSSVLRLVKCLIGLNPEALESSIGALGSVLSLNVAGLDARSEDKVATITDLIRVFAEIGRLNSEAFLFQHVLEPLYLNFHDIPVQKRLSVLKVAMAAVGPGALPASISTLLVHVLRSYEPASTALGGAECNFILLSKSAHRKATQSLRTSIPEDLFRLAIESSLSYPAIIQVGALVAIMKTAYSLLDVVATPAAPTDSTVVYEIHEDSSIKMTVSTSRLLAYDSQLSSKSAAKAAVSDRKGVAAALILLMLEFALDLMDNKLFHRSLVPIMQDNTSEAVQLYFLELSEQLLQLISLSKLLEGSEDSMRLSLGGRATNVGAGALGTAVWSQSLEMMRKMQRLLDAPTFVAILQELLEHDDAGVRQRALQMLQQRLEEMNVSKRPSGEERALLLDLMVNLRQALRRTASTLSDESAGQAHSPMDVADSPEVRVGLSQSALMCIDVLVRNLGGGGAKETLLETLEDVFAFAITAGETVAALATPAEDAAHHMGKGKKKKAEPAVAAAKSSASSALEAELLKLQGSSYLCCGTVCAALGAPALPRLADMMALMLGSISTQIVLLREASEGGGSGSVVTRARVLLLRSAVASIATIAKELCNFFQPFIARTLTALLDIVALHGLEESNSLGTEVNNCLTAIALDIPARLSLPIILETVPGLFGKSAPVAQRLSIFLLQFMTSINRQAVVVHFSAVCSLVTLSLDYRRAFGSLQGSETDSIDDSVVDGAVELCIKFTETELKTFMKELAEWQVVDTADEEQWRGASRGVLFYRLLAALSARLKSIFTPTVAFLWSEAAESLSELARETAVAQASAKKPLATKSPNKRKSASVDIASSGVVVSEYVSELIKRSRSVLELARSACTHDSSDFINEDTYNVMMPPVVSLLSATHGCISDEEYVAYTEEYVVPCLASLAVAVGKDIMWKPLNHKLLSLTRDKRRFVRSAALKALHKLFVEVGEEYLLLLPECLPYFSEVLEDDVAEVAALAGEVIRYVEDLSGERLDSYLQ